MKLQYYGHACFALRFANGTALVIDPFDPSIPYPVCDAACDAALLTHGHFDHNYTKALKGEFQTIDAPGEYSVGGAKITAIPSFHDDEGGAKRGKNLIYRIDAEGLSIAHLGDLGHLPDAAQIAALRGLDLLLIPIGGFYTIDTPTAEETISLIKPRCAVAMHYKIHADDPNPISDCAAFASDTGAARMPNEIEITAESASALPAAIIMDYKS